MLEAEAASKAAVRAAAIAQLTEGSRDRPGVHYADARCRPESWARRNGRIDGTEVSDACVSFENRRRSTDRVV